MISQFIERRNFPRIPVQARLRIKNGFIGIIETYSRDISNSGIFIYTTPVPPLARGAYLGVNMLDSANPEILFNAKVSRITQQGIGIQLVDYELAGKRYTLNELKRQWVMTRADIRSKDETI